MSKAFFIQGPIVVLPNGYELEDARGRRYEVVMMRWWQLHRWVGWWLTSRVVKGEVRIVSTHGGSFTVKVRELPDV